MKRSLKIIKLDEKEPVNKDITLDRKTFNWDPTMGDYEKNNSQDDTNAFIKKERKNIILITFLVTSILLILSAAIIYFTIE